MQYYSHKQSFSAAMTKVCEKHYAQSVFLDRMIKWIYELATDLYKDIFKYTTVTLILSMHNAFLIFFTLTERRIENLS